MKIILKHSGIHGASQVRAIVQRHIRTLEPLRQIDEAQVHVAREEASPCFHVQAHLVTPGPDILAEARDHTLAAALGKVMKQLAQEIKVRAGRRLTRMKRNLQTPLRGRGRLSHA